MTEEEITTTYKELERLLQNSPLEFYQRAMQVLDEYSSDLRHIDDSISRNRLVVIECYTKWHQQLLPKLIKYQETLANKNLRSSLSKSLAIDDQKIYDYISHITNEEVADTKKHFIIELHQRSKKYNKKRLKNFLDNDFEINSAHVKAFLTYHIVLTIIKKNSLHVYDSNRRFPVKQCQRILSKYQIHKIVKSKKAHLQHVNKQISHLHSQDNYFRPRILALNIQLITIYAAKRDYEKKIEKLENSSKDNPLKRMELYNKTTKDIREDLIATIPGTTSLTDIQRAIVEIDSIVIYVFDLSTLERNLIMTSMKQYRELIRDRDRLNLELSTFKTK